MNTVMTAGMHHRWRLRAVDLAEVGPGSRVLDVATGTGDLAAALVAAVMPGGEVVGCDFSEAMLSRARTKVPSATFDLADALELPYADGEFDAATVGFGARNFADLERGIGEMVRVVRSGGHVVILEITTPTREPLASFYRGWFDRVVPALGRIAGDGAAYSYLPSSVRRFPAPVELAGAMERCGLREIRYVLTAGGIIALHVGVAS
jgi:demethylmenaquinone methyltransferase/2-methoxy-6-polyprenyl-1,4-benzoquinol methylase